MNGARATLASPLTWSVALVLSLLGNLGVLPFWGFLAANKGLWFGALTVFASFIAPTLGGAVELWAHRLGFIGAVLFVSISLSHLARNAINRFKP